MTATFFVSYAFFLQGGRKNENKKVKIFITKFMAVVLVFGCMITSTISADAAWRATKSATKNGYTLTAKAQLPYFSDWDGGGDWKTQATYGKAIKLTNSWEFYTVGGNASWSGLGVSGSGSNTGSSYTPAAKTKVVNANGRVYGTGLCFYVGMISGASFKSGNTYYSVSAKI